MITGVGYNEGVAMKKTGSVQFNHRVPEPVNTRFIRLKTTTGNCARKIGESMSKKSGGADE